MGKNKRDVRSASGRGAARRSAILKAARAAFLERGFGAATLDDVIRRAGGSRATIYQRFGSKEGLFAAIIGGLCSGLTVPRPADSGDPFDTLLDFSRRYMRMLMQPGNLGLYRIVIAESQRLPRLGRRVFEAGPDAAATRLAAYLRSETRRGRLRVADAALAARHLLEMVKGDLHTRALFGLPLPSRGAIDRCVAQAVRMFVEGCAPRGRYRLESPKRSSADRR